MHAKIERNREIMAYLDGGMTLQEVGDHYGLSRERVRKLANRERPDLKLSRRDVCRNSRPDPIRALSITRRSESLKEAALEIGCAQETIVRLLDKLGMLKSHKRLWRLKRWRRREIVRQKWTTLLREHFTIGECPTGGEFTKRTGKHHLLIVGTRSHPFRTWNMFVAAAGWPSRKKYQKPPDFGQKVSERHRKNSTSQSS
jgi:hypothetical protein